MLLPGTLRRLTLRAYPNIDRAVTIKTFQAAWRNPGYRIGHVIDTNVITMAHQGPSVKLTLPHAIADHGPVSYPQVKCSCKARRNGSGGYHLRVIAD